MYSVPWGFFSPGGSRNLVVWEDYANISLHRLVRYSTVPPPDNTLPLISLNFTEKPHIPENQYLVTVQQRQSVWLLCSYIDVKPLYWQVIYISLQLHNMHYIAATHFQISLSNSAFACGGFSLLTLLNTRKCISIRLHFVWMMDCWSHKQHGQNLNETIHYTVELQMGCFCWTNFNILFLLHFSALQRPTTP